MNRCYVCGSLVPASKDVPECIICDIAGNGIHIRQFGIAEIEMEMNYFGETQESLETIARIRSEIESFQVQLDDLICDLDWDFPEEQ